jgi:hypothetical protein
MRRAILALVFAGVLWFPATAAAAQTPTVVHVWRANLDGDAHVEHVRLMLRLEPNPYGGTLPIRRHWLEVVDRVGGHFVIARISPTMDHLFPRWVRIADFNGNGREQVFYHGFDGGAGAVPVFTGIRGWTGAAKQRLWSYAPPFPMLTHNGHRYRYDVAEAALENLAAAGTPGLEVHLRQGEALPSEPDCCPSQVLIRNYRFESGAGRWVLYQTVWRHT